MIHTFINAAVADRSPRSGLDLSERDTFQEQDIEALDRFEQRDLNPHDELSVRRHHSVAGSAAHDQEALSELTVIEAGAPAAMTPSGAAWRALKVALLILCINLAAAGLIAVVVIGPPLALLGFFVEFCVITFTGLPMLLATVSEALANDRG